MEPSQVLKDVLLGESSDQNRINQLRRALQDNPEAVINPKLRGGAMLAHQDEVKHGILAAKSISLADQMLLSLHTIIAAGQGQTVLARIRSFSASIQDNLNALPQDAYRDGLVWFIEMYRSILQAADELTGNQTLSRHKAPISATQDLSRLEQEFQSLHARVQEEATWRGPRGDYANLEPNSEKDSRAVEELVSHLKSAYVEAQRSVCSRCLLGLSGPQTIALNRARGYTQLVWKRRSNPVAGAENPTGAMPSGVNAGNTVR